MGRHKKVEELDQLTKDSIAAQKAGMSYGKWKALRPMKTKPHKEPIEVVTDKPTCIVCGKPLPEATRRKVYCSDECKDRCLYKNWRNENEQV